MITQEQLRQELSYNEITGEFRWKKAKKGRKLFGRVGRCNQYLKIYIDGIDYLGHHLAWLYVYGVIPQMIDHIDQNPLNNAISNLRLTDKSKNALNSKVYANNSSGYKGVYKAGPNRYVARIGKNNEYIGTYKTAEEAQAAHQKEALLRIEGENGKSQKEIIVVDRGF